MAGFLSGSIFTESLLSEAKDIFSEKELPELSSVATCKLAFKDLYCTYKDNVKSWWEIRSLESYIAHKIVPRGLRISITPATRINSPRLLARWEEELTKSSLNLMELLLEEERVFFEKSSCRLRELIEAALKFKTDTDFAQRETALQTSVEKFQNLIKERKHRQFTKDLREFKENRAYELGNNQTVALSESDVSSSEVEASDSETNNPRVTYPNRGRAGRRGRGYRWQGWPKQRGRGGGGFPSYTPSSSGQSSCPTPTQPNFLERGPTPYQLRDRPKTTGN